MTVILYYVLNILRFVLVFFPTNTYFGKKCWIETVIFSYKYNWVPNKIAAMFNGPQFAELFKILNATKSAFVFPSPFWRIHHA